MIALGRRRLQRLSGGNYIFALDKAAGVLARRDMLERNVMRERAKQWNPGTDQHGNARDDESLDEPRLEKPLNRDPAIDVDVPDAPRGKPCDDLAWTPRHMLDNRAGRRCRKGVTAEHKHRLLTVRPRVERQDRVVCLTAQHQRIDGGHELGVAMGFPATRRKEIEVAVLSSDEAVEARAHKDGCFHCPILLFPPAA